MPSLRGCLASGLAAALAGGFPAQAAALPVDDASAVCSGAVTVGFSPAVGAVPAEGAVTVSIPSSSLTCTGAATTAATIDGSGADPAGASCASVAVALGSGGIIVNGMVRHPATWSALGAPTDQVWQWADNSEGTAGIQGFAAAAWTGTGPGPADCLTAGLSSVTLTVVLVVAG
jgi:regulator of RNase E activity RraA